MSAQLHFSLIQVRAEATRVASLWEVEHRELTASAASGLWQSYFLLTLKSWKNKWEAASVPFAVNSLKLKQRKNHCKHLQAKP